MADADFYAAYPDEQVATNLFNGWGYNFYRVENQLRADDLMVRAKVGEILCTARASVEVAEAAFRRLHLPPPTRERPRPDPERVRQAQLLEAIGRAVGALEGQIRALPVPEADHMTQRLRGERETLDKLLRADRAMVATAQYLRTMLAAATAEDIFASNADILLHLERLTAALHARREVLQAPT